MSGQAGLLAFVTAVVAVAAVAVAYLQWRTAHQKVALDVMVKRFEIYEKLRELVSNYLRTAAFPMEDHFAFIRAQTEARFYFGEEVTEYLEKARRDLLAGDFFERYGHQQNLDFNNQLLRNDRLAAFYKDLDEMFIPYMRIDQRMPLWWLPQFKDRCMSRLRAVRSKIEKNQA